MVDVESSTAMNLFANPTLTMTLAADRRHTLVAEADVRRIRKANRITRKSDRRATRSAGVTVAAPAARPQLQPVPTGAAVVGQHVASGELEHASARVA